MPTTRKRRILVTAGPTREYLDPVRYLTNESSGQMGFALAEASRDFGANVTLIAGPVTLPTPHGIKRIDVVSARELQQATLREAKRADVVIMAAAVADWRPQKQAKQKLKKTTAQQRMTIKLVKNPDILAQLGHQKRENQLVVGFALETRALERNAKQKLERKRCDWIVANAASAMNAQQSRVILFSRDGKRIPLPKLPKEDLAVLMLSHILT